jgi:hypothetical protein
MKSVPDLFPKCICKQPKQKFSTKKKLKSNKKKGKPKGPKPLEYPDLNESTFTTFQIKYEKKLSSIAKFILNSFQKKYFYYAIDDILYLLKSNPIEQNNLLTILYSPVLSLHNNLCVNFFDIWIDQIYINEKSKVNKFLNNDFQNLEEFTYITITLWYVTRIPIKQKEPLW